MVVFVPKPLCVDGVRVVDFVGGLSQIADFGASRWMQNTVTTALAAYCPGKKVRIGIPRATPRIVLHVFSFSRFTVDHYFEVVLFRGPGVAATWRRRRAMKPLTRSILLFIDVSIEDKCRTSPPNGCTECGEV